MNEALSERNVQGEAPRVVSEGSSVRPFDGFGILLLYLRLHDSAKDRLSTLPLSEDALAAVDAVVSTVRAVEGEERNILWRAAMLRSGISPDLVDSITAIEEGLFRDHETGFIGVVAELPENPTA
jgi:hypothetical protein